ncbi:MAG: 2-C-methyl-D-erythritol 4-phosphate cytidylyltransferase [Lachnoclostridium sp.]|nr:2-C-methyl-D-erythritol 4-phosphate cytidylyltransferase [Lachnoclostridium sp.]
MFQTAAIVLAAGQGKRMQSAVAKQFLLLNGEPVVCHSLRAFEKSDVETVILVTGADEIQYCKEEIVEKYGFKKVSAIVAGGKERYHSVYEGLSALSGVLEPDGIVLIHDGARPMITQEIIVRTMDAAKEYGACVAAMPVKDTIKVADTDGFAAETLDRSTLWQIQTPQTFTYELVYRGYKKLLSDEAYQKGVTDDAMVVESMCGGQVKLVEGSYENIKVTTPEDMIVAESFLKRRIV